MMLQQRLVRFIAAKKLVIFFSFYRHLNTKYFNFVRKAELIRSPLHRVYVKMNFVYVIRILNADSNVIIGLFDRQIY